MASPLRRGSRWLPTPPRPPPPSPPPPPLFPRLSSYADKLRHSRLAHALTPSPQVRHNLGAGVNGVVRVLFPATVIWATWELLLLSQEFHRVLGASMQPTLSGKLDNFPGQPVKPDWIWVWKLVQLRKDYTKGAEQQPHLSNKGIMLLERGMLVTLLSPQSGNIIVKRVVALEGDTVTPLEPYDAQSKDVDLERKVRHELRRERLRDQGHSSPPSSPSGLPRQGSRGSLEPITIPYGHVWVEGDNSAYSVDSNTYGPVSKSLIQGIVRWKWNSWFSSKEIAFQKDDWEERVMKGRLRKRADDSERIPPEWEYGSSLGNAVSDAPS